MYNKITIGKTSAKQYYYYFIGMYVHVVCSYIGCDTGTDQWNTELKILIVKTEVYKQMCQN